VTVEDVDVWIAEGGVGRRVGTLRPSFTAGRVLASSSFEYDRDFIRDGWAVSPDLPLRPGRTYTAANQTLPGAFSDAFPDDWGQKIIRADNARRRAADPTLPARLGEFDYLLGVSDHTRMGALRFRFDSGSGGGAGPWLSGEAGVANLHDLVRILDAARRYERDEATDEDLAYLNDIATSPGGARPKANVQTTGGHLAIAKLPHSRDGSLDTERWEAVALTLASRAGLHTPRWSIATPGSQRAVLVSERFDRDEKGDRLGYMSARTALRLGVHDDGSTLTYEDFTDAIAEWSVSSVEDLHEMFGRIALTVLVNNVDDHWGNHGFLHDARGWRLAPIFDVNPSRQRGVIESRAISIDDDPRDRRIRHLLDVADAFRLTPGAARDVVGRTARAVARWDAVAAELGIPSEQRASLRVAFETPQLEWALSLEE
jgi:serine/threonine-protein kinase HipA